MKTLKLMCLAICIIALSSCRDDRTQRDRLQDDTNRIDQTDRIDNADRVDRTTTNQTTRTDADMSQLYGHLNMTQDQIESYERMKREFDSNQSATARQNQTQSDRDRRRDQYLRDILTDEQYRRYEEWKRDNTGN